MATAGREVIEPTEFIVAHVAADGAIVVHTDDFATTWPDGMTVTDMEIEKAPDGWHLLINGTRPDYNSVAVRMPVEFTPGGAIRISVAGHLNTITQTCTGDPCSACTLNHGVCQCSANSAAGITEAGRTDTPGHPTTPHCDSTIVVTTPDHIFLKA